jgi:hypothetical protein
MGLLGKFQAQKYVRAIVEANTPQLAGAVAAYYTYRDKAYAKQLAVEQVTATLLKRSLGGVAWAVFEDFI